MSEMVERVARALCKSERKNPDYIGPGADPNFPIWTTYQLRARAVISAMREPTEKMVKIEELPYSPGEMTAYWHAMIDEALK